MHKIQIEKSTSTAGMVDYNKNSSAQQSMVSSHDAEIRSLFQCLHGVCLRSSDGCPNEKGPAMSREPQIWPKPKACLAPKRRSLRAQALTSTSPAACQYFTATCCCFARTKTVTAFAHESTWLIRSFHGFHSPIRHKIRRFSARKTSWHEFERRVIGGRFVQVNG